MVDRLKPYPEYKPARLKWTDTVPSHWDVKRPKNFLIEVEDRSKTGTEMLLSMRMQSGLIPFKHVSNKVIAPQNLIGYKRTQPGDIVLNRMQASNGMFARTIEPGLVSPDYAVLRPTAKVDVRYLTYLFKTPVMRARFRGESKGLGTGTAGFLRLYSDRLFAMPVVFPPPEEQSAIADFLDNHAGLVAKFVRTKRRQIELLKHQQRTTIDKALNCAIHTTSRTTRRLKYLVNNINDQCSSRGPDDIYIALENVESWTGRVNLPDEPVQFDSQVKRFTAGDILFGKLRPYLAKVTRPNRSGVCVGEFLVLRTSDPDIMPEFLEQKLRSASFIDAVNASTIGARMPRANWDFIGTLPVSFPRSQSEQRIMIERIAEESSELDLAIAALDREINQVRAFRTRLIAEVVTGQLDVRNAACGALDISDDIMEAEEEQPAEPEEVAVGDE